MCNDRSSNGRTPKWEEQVDVCDNLFAEFLFAGSHAPSTRMRAQPVALLEEQEKKPVIIQLNEAAEQAGIRKGMTPSQALARYLQVTIKARGRMQEKSIQEMLLHYAFTLSPFVEAPKPGICTIQFTDNRDLSAKVSRVIEQLTECKSLPKPGCLYARYKSSHCPSGASGFGNQ